MERSRMTSFCSFKRKGKIPVASIGAHTSSVPNTLHFLPENETRASNLQNLLHKVRADANTSA